MHQVGNKNRLSKLSKSGSTSNLFSHFKSLRHRPCACVRACVGVCVGGGGAGGGWRTKAGRKGIRGGGMILQFIVSI